jgi:hypothetical protein
MRKLVFVRNAATVWESQFDEAELIEKKIEQITGQLGLPISQPEKKLKIISLFESDYVSRIDAATRGWRWDC